MAPRGFQFPRSNDRGPIEAYWPNISCRFRIDFRDLTIAAPLKPPYPKLCADQMLHFRDLTIAAPLKHYIGRFVEYESVRFPRSNDRGPIEAHVFEPSRPMDGVIGGQFRCREDTKDVEQKSRQRLGSYLLRHDCIYPGRAKCFDLTSLMSSCRISIRLGFCRKNFSLQGRIGVGRTGYPVPPPSEPCVRISRTRLSSWWFTALRIDAPRHRLLSGRTALAQKERHWSSDYGPGRVPFPSVRIVYAGCCEDAFEPTCLWLRRCTSCCV